MSELESPHLDLDPQQSSGPGRPHSPSAGGDIPIFASKPERGSLPAAVWAIAGLLVVLLVALVVFAGRKQPAAVPNTLQPADPYAASLPLSQLAMSESTNLSGGKVTYLDGHVHNAGEHTVAGATLQVVFQNDEQLAPQIDTVPLTLIRMREPYIDTEPMSAEPLKPGDDREFRLIFETVPPNWKTQMPEVRVIHTSLR